MNGILRQIRMKWYIYSNISLFIMLSILHFKLFVKGNPPILLWWTKEIFPHFSSKEKILISCGNVQCYSSNAKSLLEDVNTRGIMFYGTGINPLELPLPRKPTHEWALFHEESPLNNYILSHQSFIQLFNHTATFRRESDFPVTTQDIYSLQYLQDRQPVDIKEKNLQRRENRFAPLLYTQSHDNVPSYRDIFVAELMKYIDVDSYGTCLHNKDLPENLRNAAESFQKDQFLDFIANYKFHLSFENAVCNDYVTEKLMRPLHVGSVPIYYGSPKAEDWMPNNKSVIMVNNFQSPKELADYIKFLDENDDEYLKYLEYKNENGITNSFLKETIENRDWGTYDHKYYYYNTEGKPDYYQGFECYVCNQIHQRILDEEAHEKDSTKPKPTPKMANSSHLGCPRPFSPLNDRKMPPTQWEHTYDDSKTVAEAVVQMLASNEVDSSSALKYYEQIKKAKFSRDQEEL